jgi:hypothetical protein
MGVDLKNALKRRGHKSTKVLSLDETRLDERYVLARVQFLWRFEKAPAHEHEDFQHTLRARGVLPAKP